MLDIACECKPVPSSVGGVFYRTRFFCVGNDIFVIWGGRNELRPYENVRYYRDVRYDIYRNNRDVTHGI